MMHDEAKALVKELRKRRVYKDGVRRQPRKHERDAADRIEALEAENEWLRQKLELIAFGMSIELDEEDGPVQVWLDADELSDIARAALERIDRD